MRTFESVVRRPIFLLLLALLALSIACESGASLSNPSSTPRPDPKITEGEEEATIRWSVWGDPWEVEVNRRLITVFEADNPNIKIDLVHEPWSTYFEKAEQWFASGSPPDVMFLEFVPVYASRGLLENLDPYLKRDDYKLSDFYPQMLEGFTYEGSLYGLPRDNDTKVIFYNKDLFQAARVPFPSSGWTWEDLRQAAIKLTKREAGKPTQYGFAYEADDWWRLWVWQKGGEVFDNDFSPTRTLVTGKEAEEAIQWLADLTNVDKVTPPYELQRTSQDIGELFQKGQLAMAFGNHALVPGFAGTAGLHWDVAGLPGDKKQVNVAGGAGYVVTKDSRQKEAAWTFWKWLQSPKGQAIVAETGVAVPARRSVGQADIFMKQESQHNAAIFIQETELGRSNPIFPGVQEINRLFNEAFLPVWKGQKTAAAAIAEVAPRVDSLLRGS